MNGSCEYCDKDNTKALSERILSKYHDDAYTGLECTVDSESGMLLLETCLDNNYIEPVYEEFKIKINNCPMCGRKFK